MRGIVMCVLVVVLLAWGAGGVAAQEQPGAAEAKQYEIVHGSLVDIKSKRRALLLTNRNRLIDSRGAEHTVLSSIYDAPSGGRTRHARAHNAIGRKLNKYIRAHRSMGAVERLADADFIIVFNVLKETRSFIPQQPYIFGEMFVVLNGSPQDPRPRIVWQTKKELTRAEDAVGAFLKELKIVRGEK